jgi:4'-phosphopantetheinyl transferase
MPFADSVAEWKEGPSALSIGNQDVHVWRASLQLGAAQLPNVRRVLSADELVTADRFHFADHRRRYIAARGALRTILSRYLAVAPDRLGFRYGRYGKPSVAALPGGDWLQFNLSHSHEMVLIAVARGRAVGIDIEFLREGLSDGEIAERYFSPREAATFRAIAPAQRREAFFNCWTRKEAYIKARGEGLSFPLERFDVSFAPGEPPTLLAAEGDPLEPARWSMSALAPAAGYTAALVVEGRLFQLNLWQLSELPAD